MKIIGCDLHARQQTIAMLDSDTGELEEKTLPASLKQSGSSKKSSWSHA